MNLTSKIIDFSNTDCEILYRLNDKKYLVCFVDSWMFKMEIPCHINTLEQANKYALTQNNFEAKFVSTSL